MATNAYLYTAARQGYDSDAYHYGYVYYTVTDNTASVTVTLNSVGERMTVNNAYYSSYSYSGTSSVTGSINGKSITGSNSSTRWCTSRDTYISFGGTAVSTTINKSASTTSKSLSISWTWNGTTTTNSVNISIGALPTYTISYNANGGSGAPSSQTKAHGTALTLSSTTPTRSGWTFMGWGTSADDTTADYAAGGTYSTDAPATLYAIWKKDITMSFNVNGGDSGSAPSSETKSIYNATADTSFTVPSQTPTRTNYRFTGWKVGSTTTIVQPAGTVTLSSSATLYAQWEEDYIPPKFGTITVYRTDSSGSTNNGTGTYAKLVFSWTEGSLAGTTLTTTATATYRNHTSTATPTTITTSTGTSISTVFGGGGLAADQQYDVFLTLSVSGHTDVTYITYISTENFTIDVNADGTTVAFMMIAPDTATGVIAPDYNLYIDQTAQSGTDYYLVDAINDLSWEDLLDDIHGFIDTSTNETGSIPEGGVPATNSSFTRTDFIPVKYTKYQVTTSIPSSTSVFRIHGYDSTQTWVQQIHYFTTSGQKMTEPFDIPDGIEYVRMSYAKTGLDNTGLFLREI